MITKTELKERWSDALIKKYAPTIVKKKKNIYGGLTCYYSIEEIKKIERRKTFQADLEKTLKRKANAKETSVSVENKLRNKKIEEFLDKLVIDLSSSKDELIDKAIDHYNELHWDSDYYADRSCDKDFLLRITQNYVRHMCSNYEDIILYATGKYKNDAYYSLKKSINERVRNKLAS